MTSVNHSARAEIDVFGAHSAFNPPRRIPISQGARENLYFKQPGGIPGPWSSDETPYMIEPMDTLASRRHEAVCFVGPARTGKTAGLMLGWMAHSVVNDPGDMLMISMTQDKSREFSKVDIDRAIANSEKLKDRIAGAQYDNTHDKMFVNGMWLKIAWPTASNVASSTYRYVAITDLDRMPNAENVDGEGPLFKLALKRTTTFMSRGMTLVESSPGIELSDPHWHPVTAHEAPPATGIVGIYNQSDRRRLYWRCPLCDHYFQASPGLDLFRLPSEDTLLEIVREANLEEIAAEHNRIVCPHCEGKIGPRSKQALNVAGRWLQDGLMLTHKNELVGKAQESSIAGFWLGGVSAAYQSWRSIVLRYLQGLRVLALTNDEETLRTTVNTDQGASYMPLALRKAAADNLDPANRLEEDMRRYVAPADTRVIIATVDVQGGIGARFIVQIHAIGPYREKWIIDRYEIKLSEREGIGGKAPIDPARYVEDWDQITEQVMRKTYRTPFDNVELRVMMTVVDSGGEDGVTDRAYEWFRKMRQMGLANRVMLVKGVGRKSESNAPLVKVTLVGEVKNGSTVVMPADIPLHNLNSNRLKDIINNGLKRTAPGPGFVHLPKWLPMPQIDELKAEIRNPDGTWSQIRTRNETFDLLYYCEAGCLKLGLDRIDWTAPPHWAKPIMENRERLTREERREMQASERVEPPPKLEVPAPKVHTRRVASSRYMR